MKSLSSVLFAMLVSVSACGGERRESTSTEPTPVSSTAPVAPVVDAPKVEPVGTPVQPSPVVAIAVPETYADALKLGGELVARGEHGKAREVLQLAAKLDKQRSEPHIELARSYIATNERALAIKSAAKAVKLAPTSSQAYNTLGRAELLRHSYDDAIEAFGKATELNADNVWAWNNLGFTYLTLKRYQEAVDALVEATSRKGTAGYMWNNLGTAYEHLDLLDEARDAFEHGGKLGSVAAASSRKRLEGVDTIVVINDAAGDETGDAIDAPVADEVGAPVEHGYDVAEPMPEPELPEVTDEDIAEDTDDSAVGPEVEESGVDVEPPSAEPAPDEAPQPALPGVL